VRVRHELVNRRVGTVLRRFAAVPALLALSASIATAAGSFPAFESGQVRPLVLSPNGERLFAVNTPDNRLEVFDVGPDGIRHSFSVTVGLEPVAVAARNDEEVWVVNHLSDSVSVVSLKSGKSRVVATLLVGDEPRDIVFGGERREKAFISAARRGQNHPDSPSLTTPGTGRADVWVFDARHRGDEGGAAMGGRPLGIVPLFGDTPRALAVSPDGLSVYAAVFFSGNRTTVVGEDLVCDGGAVAAPCEVSGRTMPGGLPAPNANSAGVPGPETGLIVRQDDVTGAWRDGLGRDWSGAVPFSLPDQDVFRIDARRLEVTQSWARVGTVLFGMTVNPKNGRVYVTNTEARNEVRFEGLALQGWSSVRGHLHEARVTVLDGSSVKPRHLNKHLDYSVVPTPFAEKRKSLATPTDLVVSADGTTAYVAAFGSSKVAALRTREFETDTFEPRVSSTITVSGGGPSGLALDEARGRLYVLTRFDNAVSVIDLASRREVAHVAMPNPEPTEIREGRPFLYDAVRTSSNGEASCSSCHVFGDLDGLGWDLGDPDLAVAPNPNPFHFGDYQDFHPLKGPMTTQSLRGMANAGPMHWRGDRSSGGDVEGDALDEAGAFGKFDVAFRDLLGREKPLGEKGMQRFTDFVLRLTYPPNPVRPLDGTLAEAQQRGRDLYFGPRSDTAEFSCAGCHRLAPARGFFGADGTTSVQGGPQNFKTPHLRNLYQKIGMFGRLGSPAFPMDTAAPAGPQVRGFGFQHDGSVDTLERFHAGSTFLLEAEERRDLEQFLLAYDSDLAPVVGQQVTLRRSNVEAASPRVDLLVARAAAGDCDLVVHGLLGGRPRGWLRQADGAFRINGATRGPFAESRLRSRALRRGGAMTFTCVPPGSGQRIALDRDEDGVFDDDERLTPGSRAPQR
jgi:DNA-binding beta-propeller fold protein YncE